MAEEKGTQRNEMPTKKKKPERSRLEVDERRAQLLALGLELFSQNPYDELKIDAVAEKAGISKGLLYHYFPTKRAFYVEVLRVASQELLRVTEPGDGTPLERVQRGIDAYLRYVESHRVAYVALLRGGVGSDSEVLAVIEETRTQFLTRIVEGIGVNPLPPIWGLAMRGWIGFVEASSIEWAANPAVSMDELKTLLLTNLLATVSSIFAPE
jgi:AcrR family transcriptional regulator